MKKSICGITLAAMVFAAGFNALAFSDMEGDSYSWASTAVEEMSKLNIIQGYEDGTFKPGRQVSKEESLILMARICGYSEESSAEYIKLAEKEYETALEDFTTPYKSGIAYLLYRGVLEEKDAATYASKAAANTPLKRYEAAVLLTKLMNANEEAKNAEKFDMKFDDIKDIPNAAKGYVDYVCKNEIMNGMGDNLFVPEGDVTRAQMATLLYRVMKNRDFSYVTGTVSSYTEDNYNLKILDSDEKTLDTTVRDNIPVRLDGKESEIKAVPSGSNIRITYSGKGIAFIECISPMFDDTVQGIYAGYERISDVTMIKITDPSTGKQLSYPLSANPTIVRDGENVTITALRAEDDVVIDIVNGKAAYIKAENKTSTVVGKIDHIELEPELIIYIDVAGKISEYKASSEPTVRRNNKAATLADVMAGDSVTITLEYGVISEITASSTITKKSGFLQEITISNTPSIVVKANDVLTSYEVLRTVTITRDGSEATMYDLRIGDSVTVTVEGSTVTAIELTSAIENSTVTGVVSYINTSYGYIKLDGVNELIFTNKAKVQDKSGKALTLRDVKEGVTLTVFGTQTPGSFEATLLIIVS